MTVSSDPSVPVSTASLKVSSSATFTWPDHWVIAQVACLRQSAVLIRIGQGRFTPYSIFSPLHSMASGLVDQSGQASGLVDQSGWASASHTSVTHATSLHVPAKLHVPAIFQIFSSNCDWTWFLTSFWPFGASGSVCMRKRCLGHFPRVHLS